MEPHHWIPVGIAIASLIVIPACVAIGRRILDAWREAEHARFARKFVPREEMEMQFDQLNRAQTVQHEENRKFLDTIRTEAMERQGRVLQSIEDVQKNTRSDVISIHARIDKLFELLTRGNG